MENKIILLIIGGLGGVQSGPNMLTELQQAHKPNLNALVRKSVCGLLQPAAGGKIPDKKTALQTLLGYRTTGKVSFAKKYHRRAGLVSHDPVYQREAAALSIAVHKCQEGSADIFGEVGKIHARYDFIIVHIDAAEPFGRQKEYYEKIKIIEEIDTHIAELQQANPSVLCVTGDFSLPSAIGRITWHPLPVMICSPTCRYDTVLTYDEIACIQGGLGIFPAKELMSFLLAHAD